MILSLMFYTMYVYISSIRYDVRSKYHQMFYHCHKNLEQDHQLVSREIWHVWSRIGVHDSSLCDLGDVCNVSLLFDVLVIFVCQNDVMSSSYPCPFYVKFLKFSMVRHYRDNKLIFLTMRFDVEMHPSTTDVDYLQLDDTSYWRDLWFVFLVFDMMEHSNLTNPDIDCHRYQ